MTTARVAPPAPDFTAEALRTGGLVDMGVVQVNEIASARPPLIATLEQVLTSNRPDIPLTRAARAEAMMGDSTTRFLLLGYELHGVPEQIWLARAADSLREVARFGVLARVESDEVGYSNREVPAKDPTPEVPFETVKVTHRDARVSVIIYDLQTRASVFSGVYTGIGASAETDTIPLPDAPPETFTDQTAQVGAANVTVGPKTDPRAAGFGPPPPLERAVGNAFIEWVRTLPGTTAPAND